MSASLSALGSGIGAIQGAAAELSGNFSVVTLGAVVFGDMEVPETMTRSLSMMLEEKVLPGGVVQLQQFGSHTAPLTWSGYLQGDTALLRCLEIEAMYLAGQVVPLFWFDRVVLVLIETWAPEDKNINWIKYSITCRVVQDLRAMAITAIEGVAAAVLGAVGSAILGGGNLV